MSWIILFDPKTAKPGFSFSLSLIAVIFGSLLLCSTAVANESDDGQLTTAAGKIITVTLYRDQAMITREVDIPAEFNADRIVIEGLPQQVNPASLFAEGDANTSVRATQFARRPLEQSPQQSIRDKQLQIDTVQQELQSIASQQNVLTARLDYLTKLESFVAPVSMQELGHGVLNAETLKSMTEFQFQQRQEIAQQQLELQHRQQKVQQQLELHQRELAELTNSLSRESFEAIVFLTKPEGQATKLRLSYLVSGCGWQPSYSLRASDELETSTLEYNALIQQFSGEDWRDVRLTLSTASPTLSAMRPALAAHRLTLGNEQTAGVQVQESIAQTYNSSKANQFMANNVLQQAVDFSGNAKASLNLNQAIEDLSTIELNADLRTLKNLIAEQAVLAEQPSISYELANSVTLSNRRDQQIVRVANPALPSKMYLVATPILTTLVYREAELTNKSEHDLLAGPIAIYVGEQFVGRAEIPLVSRGQRFVVGLGADPQLRAKREVLDRTEETQGGNRRITMRYRLKVENFRSEAASVRLLDRMPLAAESTDIQIKLVTGIPEISKDAIYQELERPEGILRWDVTVPANGEHLALEYGYSIEFDRQYALTKATDRPGSEQEFEQFLLRRNRY